MVLNNHNDLERIVVNKKGILNRWPDIIMAGVLIFGLIKGYSEIIKEHGSLKKAYVSEAQIQEKIPYQFILSP